MLVMDELHQGRRLYRAKISTPIGAHEKGILIVKYLYSIGMSRHEIEAELFKKYKAVFLRIITEEELYKRIDYVVDMAEANPPKTGIATLNQAELDLVNGQENETIRLIFMAMMLAYKFHSGDFLATSRDIQKLAKIKMNSCEFRKVFAQFMELGYFNSYVKMEKRYGTRRYKGYYKPSEELLKYTKMGSYVVMVDDFRNLWVRIREILGYDYKYYNCKYCGCLDVKKAWHQSICPDCRYENQKIAEAKWKEDNDWKHPNMKDSKYTYYYYTPDTSKQKKEGEPTETNETDSSIG